VKYAALVARLTVYAAAFVVVVTARLPGSSTGVTALRLATPASLLDPVRLLLAAIIVTGVCIELLRRRPVWH